MTPAALNAFRSRNPNCELALYADLASRTVLSADGSLRYPQEYLDALCASGADVFAAAPSALGDADHAVFLSLTGARAFIRNREDPNEALCCICSADTDMGALVAAARKAISQSHPKP